MQVATYSAFRKDLKSHLDKVTNNHEPLIIPRGESEESVVVISLSDYNSMVETNHLLKSTNNRTRLLDALDRSKTGKFETHELITE